MKLPLGAAFVVSNGLEESVKAVDAEKRYNRRVTEGKLAAKLVAKHAGLPNWAAQETFRQLQGDLALPSPGALLPLIEAALRAGGWSVADCASAAGVEPAALFEGDRKKAGALRVLASLPRDEPALELLKRARHVCSEAERVFAFQAACGGARPGGAPIEGGAQAQLRVLGELMSASHASCRDDYECSSPGLDELTSAAMAAGAFGSRLTGAGWGGCAVSLVAQDRLEGFLQAMRDAYYAPKGYSAQAAPGGVALWASAPGSGAAIFTPPTSFEI